MPSSLLSLKEQCSVDSERGAPGQLFRQLHVVGSEGSLGARGNQREAPQDPAAGQERDTHVRAEAKLANDAKVFFVPRRAAQEIHGHLGRELRATRLDHANRGVGAFGVRRIPGTEQVGQWLLLRVGVDGHHPPEAPVLTDDVDQAQVSQEGHGQAPQAVHRADQLLDYLPEAEEHLVAHGVSVPVVDSLEVVQVEEHQGHRRPEPPLTEILSGGQ